MYDFFYQDGPNSHLFSFKTKNEILYLLKLTKYGKIAQKDRYIVDLDILEGDALLGMDVNIKHTVTKIVTDFIKNNKDSVLTYVCEASDNRQHSRHKKFKKWFNEHECNDIQYYDYTLKEEKAKDYIFVALYDPSLVKQAAIVADVMASIRVRQGGRK